MINIPQALNDAIQHHQAGRLDVAERIYRAVLAQNPNQVDALNLLGVIADYVGQHEPAVELIRRAIAIMPRQAIPHFNLSIALSNLGRIDEALAEADTAIALQADLPVIARQCRTQLLLLQGRFAEGWRESEQWRNKSGALAMGRALAQSEWRGESLENKTILIYPEEGLGDAVHYVRYAPLLVARGARVLTGCFPLLTRLFQSSPDLGQVVTSGQGPPAFDVHCSLLSLPFHFGTELNSIPAKVPYLAVDPALLKAWGDRLGPRDGNRRVGLVWAGRPEHLNDRRRSMPLSALAPLAAVGGVRFYSLQKGPAAAQAVNPPAGMELVDLSGEFTDLADTAAVMTHLDLVIGVDTGPLHVAGALGRPVWMMLPLFPDCRWLLHRDDSPWYPTMRLFRQRYPGDWSSVVTRVADALAALPATGASR